MSSFCVRCLVVVLCVLPVSAMAGEEGPAVIPFIGRFHILALHLPIGLLLGAFMIEAYALFRPNDSLNAGKLPFVLLGALSAWVAVGLGIMLEQSGEYSGDLVFFHKWSGVAVAVVASITYFIKRSFLKTGSPKMRLSYRIALVACAGLLSYSGHLGGSLVHSEEYLDPVAYFSQEPVVVSAKAGEFESKIWPILDKHCVKCHGPEKEKGGFRLDSKHAILIGGDESDFEIVPGNSEKSPFYWMTTLDEDDDLIMPPKAPYLTLEEQTLIKEWVDEGADFDGWESSIPTEKPKTKSKPKSD